LKARLKAVGSRLLQLVVLLGTISTTLFLLLRLSGDPAILLAGEGASEETIQAIRADNGFDKPLLFSLTQSLRFQLVFGSALSQPNDDARF